jgi:hypothetical protein
VGRWSITLCARAASLHAPTPEQREYAELLLAHAASDLGACRVLMAEEDMRDDVVGFHAQQRCWNPSTAKQPSQSQPAPSSGQRACFPADRHYASHSRSKTSRVRTRLKHPCPFDRLFSPSRSQEPPKIDVNGANGTTLETFLHMGAHPRVARSAIRQLSLRPISSIGSFSASFLPW